ncbi:inter alpha-trypsin inhibitor, heavy chain 4-like isoform X2 [Neltuma alba]|nr:inter alpha-trypsin inhibitor, heavy chain 4-like isoform X2 [Prosopis alba]XP_028796660.1 inter alpha-trypsin inhibitor, heavy chain 4-like isoform X2 [Prosopis alba]
MSENNEKENAIGAKQAGFIKPNIFTLNIPEIDGGSNLSIKISWSQKLLYGNDQFSLIVPFAFPAFVKPAGKRIPKREKIQINVNAGVGSELLCQTISHPLKEVRRYAGSISFLYDSQVLEWSNIDFHFSYSVSSSHINGGILLESAPLHDFNERDMFYMYLYPGNLQSSKVFKKDIVFVVDISGSMQGKLIDDIKTALSAALSKLDPDDSFSIIAFNGESYLFSTSVELASQETVERAIEWIKMNFVAEGATNILHPLNKAIEMLSGVRRSIPMIFLVTDGSVEDERHICDIMKEHMINKDSICPRIYTFGIGPFCNHYFLSMLAAIGRGQYDAALDVDLVTPRILKLFDKASSIILANITIDMLNDLDEVEVCPFQIPDLSSEGPLMFCGRYKGAFPEKLTVKGILADFSNFTMVLEIRNAKDIPIQRVFAKQQIEHLTSQAWVSQNKQIEDKVAKLSLETGFMSEYTRMVLLENDELLKKVNQSDGAKEVSKKGHPPKVTNVQGQRTIRLPKLSIGFGNLSATVENISPGAGETKLPEAAEQLMKAAQYCCSSLCDQCCCACCINVCTRLNNQCLTALTQLCIGLGCLGCLSCCSELCCHGNE